MVVNLTHKALHFGFEELIERERDDESQFTDWFRDFDWMPIPGKRALLKLRTKNLGTKYFCYSAASHDVWLAS